jgi:hypothetical protein
MVLFHWTMTVPPFIAPTMTQRNATSSLLMTTSIQTKDRGLGGKDAPNQSLSHPLLPLRVLEPAFNKNGFTYELVRREGDVAIYKQRLRPGVGCLAYEVWRIRVKEQSIMFGNIVPRREVGPSDSDFGTYGWSYPDLPRAKAKMAELIDTPAGSRR